MPRFSVNTGGSVWHAVRENVHEGAKVGVVEGRGAYLTFTYRDSWLWRKDEDQTKRYVMHTHKTPDNENYSHAWHDQITF